MSKMSSDQNPETLVMCAKLAEQAERYDDMAEVCMAVQNKNATFL